MRHNQVPVSSFLLSLITCALIACTSPQESESPERVPLGKTDAIGSCDLGNNGNSCGGPAAVGNCWCDDLCEQIGDCCNDKGQLCDAPDLCDSFVGPCHSDSDCGEGFACEVDPNTCSPSGCGCDPATGDIFCTSDCAGGECVPAPVDLCDSFVGPCHSDSDCGEGFACEVDPNTCSPSGCTCDPATGDILCTSDCSGGECVPAAVDLCDSFVGPCQSDSDCGDGSSCVADPNTCSPSACGCDPATGNILCTSDCGGGECVQDLPIVCPTILCAPMDPCANGFVIDENGCGTCECAPECAEELDCFNLFGAPSIECVGAHWECSGGSCNQSC